MEANHNENSLNTSITSVLIAENYNKGDNAVSAKALYNWLGGLSNNYAKWYKKNILNNAFATELIDYQILHTKDVNSDKGRPSIDFALSFDFAKKIAMMSRTQKGEEARDYFIACEKVLNGQNQPHKWQRLQHWEKEKHQKLINEIKKNLKVGDITDTAKMLGTSYYNVKDVLGGKYRNKQIIEALYGRALKNKQNIIDNYDELINNLKEDIVMKEPKGKEGEEKLTAEEFLKYGNIESQKSKPAPTSLILYESDREKIDEIKVLLYIEEKVLPNVSTVIRKALDSYLNELRNRAKVEINKE